MENQNLYFIAIVLPEELCKQVNEVRRDIADRFQSQKSLKIVPHITLKAPFKLPVFFHDHVVDWFRNLVIEIPSFQINLKGFGAFKNPEQPVIFINPLPNEILASLQKQIIQEFYPTFEGVGISATELIFRPHITVAYRDLKPEMFDLAWAEFENRKFSGEFIATNFQLLKHDGRMWHSIEHHGLK